jgi:hypothetical protein
MKIHNELDKRFINENLTQDFHKYRDEDREKIIKHIRNNNINNVFARLVTFKSLYFLYSLNGVCLLLSIIIIIFE